MASPVEYPICIAEDNHVLAAQDLVALENHLLQNLCLAENAAKNIAKGLKEFLHSHRVDGEYLLRLSSDMFQLILQCLHPGDIRLLFCQSDEYRKTTLDVILVENKTDILKMLLWIIGSGEVFEMLHTSNSCGWTALHTACSYNNSVAMKIIREHVSPEEWFSLLEAKDRNGQTPLSRALMDLHSKCIKIILRSLLKDQNYQLLQSFQNVDQVPLLHHLLLRRRNDIIQTIKDNVKQTHWLELLRLQDASGRTALMQATVQHDIEAVKLMNMSLNSRQRLELLQILDRKSGKTPLDWAAYRGQSVMVTQLLESMAEKDSYELVKSTSTTSTSKKTPLQWAVDGSHSEVVKILLGLFITSNDNDTNDDHYHLKLIFQDRDDSGSNIFMQAVQKGTLETVEVFLNVISSTKLQRKLLYMTDTAGQTILHGAASRGHTDIMKLIYGYLVTLSKQTHAGGDENAKLLIKQQDCLGNSPLLSAVVQGHIGVAKLIRKLVTFRMWVNLLLMKNNSGSSCLLVAAWQNNEEMFKLLQHALSYDQIYELLAEKDKINGLTILHWACWLGKIELVLILQKSITAEQWCQLLKIGDNKGWTPLHVAAWKDRKSKSNMMTALKRTVNNNMWISLFSMSQLSKERVGDFEGFQTPYLDPDDPKSAVKAGCAADGTSTLGQAPTGRAPSLGVDRLKNAEAPTKPKPIDDYERLVQRVQVDRQRSLDSTQKCQIKLHNIHGDVHLILAAEMGGLPSHTVTCTLASYSQQAQDMHLLLLVKGYVTSIPHFSDNISGHILKVSTTHSQNPILFKLLDNEEDPIFASHLAIVEPERLLDQQFSESVLHCHNCIDSSEVSAERCYQREGLKIRLYYKEEPIISCEIWIDGQPQLSTRGSLSINQIFDNEFESRVAELHNLNEPHDDSDVTAVAMVVKQTNDSIIALYMFLAGHLAESVEEKEDMWMISTVRLKNSELYRMVMEECKVTLGDVEKTADLENKIVNWKNESLFFTITTSVPGYNCEGIESLNALPVICSKRFSQNSKTASLYIFRHPKNETVVIEILEPCSPGQSNLVPGDERKSVAVPLQASRQTQRETSSQNARERNPRAWTSEVGLSRQGHHNYNQRNRNPPTWERQTISSPHRGFRAWDNTQLGNDGRWRNNSREHKLNRSLSNYAGYAHRQSSFHGRYGQHHNKEGAARYASIPDAYTSESQTGHQNLWRGDGQKKMGAIGGYMSDSQALQTQTESLPINSGDTQHHTGEAMNGPRFDSTQVHSKEGTHHAWQQWSGGKRQSQQHPQRGAKTQARRAVAEPPSHAQGNSPIQGKFTNNNLQSHHSTSNSGTTNSRAFCEMKMNSRTHTRLMENQKNINHVLRAYHHQEGSKWNHTVTAITITSSDKAPFIILFGGILTSLQSNNFIDGYGDVGVIVSLQWLFNQEIINTLATGWQKKFGDRESDLNLGYPFATITVDCLNEGRLENMDFPFSPPPASLAIITSDHLTIKFQPVPVTVEYMVKICVNGRDKTMQLHALTSPLSAITLPVPSSNTELSETKESVYKSLNVQASSEKTGCRVTISFHHVTVLKAEQHQTTSSTRRPSRGSNRGFTRGHNRRYTWRPTRGSTRESTSCPGSAHSVQPSQHHPGRLEEKFIICAIGDEADLTLPTRFVYHDPRQTWVCATWSEDNSLIMEKLTGVWADTDNPPQPRQLAKHAVYLSMDEDCTQLLQIDGWSTDVRYSRKHRKKHLMDTWAHERNPNSLFDVIKGDEKFCEDLRAQRDELLRACTGVITKKFPKLMTECLRLCHCKMGQDESDHSDYVLKLSGSAGSLGANRAESSSSYSQTYNTHITFSTPPPPEDILAQMNKDSNLCDILRRDVDKHNEELCKHINKYISDNLVEELPTSFEFPTIQLCLNKIPWPNQMGPQVSNPKFPQRLFLQRSNEAHFRFSKPSHTANRKVNATEAQKLVSKLLSHVE